MNKNPFACYAPFPDPPPLIADYIAERSAEESVLDGPSPWDIGALTAELLAPLPDWLDSVCRWLNATYAWQPQHVIPPCWTEHHHLAYEIAAVAFARYDAYLSPSSAVVWHEQYDRFLTRMDKTLGQAGDDCRGGRHATRSACFQLDAWPSAPSPSDSPQTAPTEHSKKLA